MALPAPTPAAVSVDYIPVGVGRLYTLVPTIANPAAPKIAELSAGTNWTSEITAVNGWDESADSVDNSTYGSTFKSSIPGMLSVADSSWTLKLSSTGTDARATLTIGMNAFVVNYPDGNTSTGHVDVWPVRIKSANPDQVAKDALATFTVMFAVTSQPYLSLQMPTS